MRLVRRMALLAGAAAILGCGAGAPISVANASLPSGSASQHLFCGCEVQFCTPASGGHYCVEAGQLCCRADSQYTCQGDISECTGVPIYCAGTSDCPSGQVCCALPGGDFVSSVECRDFCGADSDSPDGFRLCTSDDDCLDLELPCKVSSGLSPFHRCRH